MDIWDTRSREVESKASTGQDIFGLWISICCGGFLCCIALTELAKAISNCLFGFMQFMDRQWHDMYRQWIYSWDECLYSFPRKSRPSEWIRCRLIWTKKRRQNLEIASIAVSRHCRHQKYCDWQWIVVRVVFRDISLRCIRKSIDRLELIGKWVLWPIRFFVETFDFQK